MTGLADIADRHSRPVGGLGDGIGGLVVRIYAGSLARIADQHLLVCLTNLLCRMAGTVASIELDAPERELQVMTPIGRIDAPAFEAMRRIADWAVGDVIKVVRPSVPAADAAISLPLAVAGNDVTVHVMGAGWRAWVGNQPPRSVLPDSSNPIGPYFAACLAAGEVFKQARGLQRGRRAHDEGYSLWDGAAGSVVELADGPSLVGLNLPPFYLVGSGAVGQGMIAVLGAAELGAAAVITIDDDSHDWTNLNRCFIAGIGTGDVGAAKVEAVTRSRDLSGLAGGEFKGTLQQFIQHGPVQGMPEDMRLRQLRDEFDIVVSAVDRNTSRWDIRGLNPKLVVGGSTDGLTAKAMVFRRDPSEPCLACHNAREADGAHRRLLEQQLRGLSDGEVRSRLRNEGIGDKEIEEVIGFLRDSPGCGSAGERVLGELAIAGAREFSVSFVSMAAAVISAARLLSMTSFRDQAPKLPLMSSMVFKNLSLVHDAVAVDETCVFCRPSRAYVSMT